MRVVGCITLNPEVAHSCNRARILTPNSYGDAQGLCGETLMGRLLKFCIILAYLSLLVLKE